MAVLVQRAVEAGTRSLDRHDELAPAVRIDPAVRGRHVGVDKRRFERVMVNLMENAAHYGGGAREVAVVPEGGGPGHDHGGRRRTGHRSGGTDQGVRALLPGLGLGTSGHRHRQRAGAGPGGRAHAPHGTAPCGSRRRPRAAPASPSACPSSTATAPTGTRTRHESVCSSPRWRRCCRRPGRGLCHPDPAIAADHSGLEGSPQPDGAPPADHHDDAAQSGSFVPVKVYFLNSARAAAARRSAGAVTGPARLDPRFAAAGAVGSRRRQAGSRHAIPHNVAVLSTRTEGNVVTVNMNTAFGQITGTPAGLAVGQIVATVAEATNGFDTGVLFEIDGSTRRCPSPTGPKWRPRSTCCSSCPELRWTRRRARRCPRIRRMVVPRRVSKDAS